MQVSSVNAESQTSQLFALQSTTPFLKLPCTTPTFHISEAALPTSSPSPRRTIQKELGAPIQAPAAASANTLRAHRTFRAAPQVSIQPALAFHIHPGDGRHLESRALETRSAKPERSPGETERSAPLLPGCPSDIPGSRCTPSAAPHLVLLCTSSCPAQEPRF